MKKIERVIESCSDCRHKRTYCWENSNCDFLVMCCYKDESFGENMHIPFVLMQRSSRDTFIIEIPENCPLETYTE